MHTETHADSVHNSVLRGCVWTSQVARVVKNLPASAGDVETELQSVGREDPLEKKMATHSSLLAWRILWTEEPGTLQSMGALVTKVT